MVGEKTSSDTYQTPDARHKEYEYSTQDAEEYYQGVEDEPDYRILGENEQEEAGYDSTQIPEERLKNESIKGNIERLKARKIGYHGLNAALRDAA